MVFVMGMMSWNLKYFGIRFGWLEWEVRTSHIKRFDFISYNLGYCARIQDSIYLLVIGAIFDTFTVSTQPKYIKVSEV